MDEQRLDDAILFLSEAVYRSRERQAAIAPGAEPRGPADGGRCGLGEKAAVDLNLSARGRQLFERLWPGGLEPSQLERVQTALAAWIRRQDALDRTRNHFLRDFRAAHGFDRSAYTAEQQSAYRRGLDDINARENDERRSFAARMMDAAR